MPESSISLVKKILNITFIIITPRHVLPPRLYCVSQMKPPAAGKPDWPSRCPLQPGCDFQHFSEITHIRTTWVQDKTYYLQFLQKKPPFQKNDNIFASKVHCNIALLSPIEHALSSRIYLFSSLRPFSVKKNRKRKSHPGSILCLCVPHMSFVFKPTPKSDVLYISE